MQILLSNDDGYQAPGIETLYQMLVAKGPQQSLVLMAPDRNRSAASNSLTLLEPLRITQDDPDVPIYAVNGTPTDCVHLAINGALDTEFDLVLSGINAGANMGDDVLYSGTVAAAMEGRFLGRPSIAVSLVGQQHFTTAAEVVLQVLAHLDQLALNQDTILNVNVPDVPVSELRGIQVTRLGQRHRSAPVLNQQDPRGQAIHWVGPAGEAADAAEGTDFWAIEQGYASVTPLHIDLTHYAMREKLNSLWPDLNMNLN